MDEEDKKVADAQDFTPADGGARQIPLGNTSFTYYGSKPSLCTCFGVDGDEMHRAIGVGLTKLVIKTRGGRVSKSDTLVSLVEDGKLGMPELLVLAVLGLDAIITGRAV